MQLGLFLRATSFTHNNAKHQHHMLFPSITSLVAKILVARPLQRVLKDESPDKQDRYSYAKPHPIPMSKGKYADKGCGETSKQQ